MSPITSTISIQSVQMQISVRNGHGNLIHAKMKIYHFLCPQKVNGIRANERDDLFISFTFPCFCFAFLFVAVKSHISAKLREIYSFCLSTQHNIRI